jgi:hypothetical protein
MAVSLIQSLARYWAVGGSLADGTETQTYRANTSTPWESRTAFPRMAKDCGST